MNSLCVFCGSSSGRNPVYLAAAQELGTLLARRGMTVVYGGGNVGLMGALADSAMDAGGSVVGVIPAALQERELAHTEITRLIVVETMHARKAQMAQLADGFISLPGGFGTLEEFCEIVTWAQLGIHRKPCGLLNVEGYFDSLLSQFGRGMTDGFIRGPHRELVLAANSPEELLDQFAAYKPPELPRWIES